VTGVFAGTGILVAALLLARFARAAWREISSAIDDEDEGAGLSDGCGYENPKGEHI
jgi:hypothetical protein